MPPAWENAAASQRRRATLNTRACARAGQFDCVHPHGDPWQCEKAHDFFSGFHVFAVEWEADEIRWYVDDELYWKRTLGVDHVSFIPTQ